MAALAGLGSKHDCSIVCVRHLTKNTDSKAAYRGSALLISLLQLVLSLLVGCDPNDPSKRAMVQTKCNLAAFGNSIGFDFDNGAFKWTGICALTASQILGHPRNNYETEASGKSAEAKNFLTRQLAEGPKLQAEITAEADLLGISQRTLSRAKKELNIVSKKIGFGERGEWEWQL